MSLFQLGSEVESKIGRAHFCLFTSYIAFVAAECTCRLGLLLLLIMLWALPLSQFFSFLISHSNNPCLHYNGYKQEIPFLGRKTLCATTVKRRCNMQRCSRLYRCNVGCRVDSIFHKETTPGSIKLCTYGRHTFK